jgi:hypothetical protein
MLLILIALLSAFSTIVPQGKEQHYYTQRYPDFITWLILSTHFHRFFRSALFLIPAGLFFFNLLVCAADRFVRRARTSAPKRYGPDLIHLGALLLMIAGLVSLIARREWYMRLAEGESVGLAQGYELFLTSFEKKTYSDGRPREYVSTVQLLRGGQKRKTLEIRVNRPLKVGKMRIFQDSYSYSTVLFLVDPNNNRYSLKRGESLRVGERYFTFSGIFPEYEEQILKESYSGSAEGELIELRDPGKRAFLLFHERDSGGKIVGVRLLAPADSIAGYTIGGVFLKEQSGLRIVQDPSFTLVLISFLIVGAGLGLTFLQKMGDKKK